MKDKRPIEEQVAELTEVQRKSLGKIFTGHMIVVVVLVLAVFVSGGIFFYNVHRAHELYEEAKLECEMYVLTNKMINSNYIMTDEYNALTKASHEAFIKYCDTGDAVIPLIFATGIACIVVGIAMPVFLKVKFPYYSEKKYFYVRKMSKGR